MCLRTAPVSYTHLAALCLGLWALFARLVLCRMPHLLHKQFTQPILWALSVPAWLGSACLLLMLPVSFSGEAEEAVALSIMLLEAVLLAPAAALAALVLGVLAVVKAARHLALSLIHIYVYKRQDQILCNQTFPAPFL